MASLDIKITWLTDVITDTKYELSKSGWWEQSGFLHICAVLLIWMQNYIMVTFDYEN